MPQLGAARCLHQIRTCPGITRYGLRDGLGISLSSVTRYVAALGDAGLIRQQVQVGADPERPGRPVEHLVADGAAVAAVGVHLGFLSSVVAVFDGAGRTISARTIALEVARVPAARTLDVLAGHIRDLVRDRPVLVGVGVAVSAPVRGNGTVVSPSFRWEAVDLAGGLAERIAAPVSVVSAVEAMAGNELYSAPFATHTHEESPWHADSTLYFYAREFVGHAWIFGGAVHRPHSGVPSRYLAEDSELGLFASCPRPGLAQLHPLSNSRLVAHAHQHGIDAADFADLVRLGESDTTVRGLLDERAVLLGKAISRAVDIVDPRTLTFAGEAFTSDPRTVRLVLRGLQGPQQHRELRIQRAGTDVLSTAARATALLRFWHDPLGALPS